jgi:hypothetical protein
VALIFEEQKMKSAFQPQPKKQSTPGERLPYETPAIIHENYITTRAGSPIGFARDGDPAVDPADLFGE